jgi:stage V sporulation protein S
MARLVHNRRHSDHAVGWRFAFSNQRTVWGGCVKSWKVYFNELGCAQDNGHLNQPNHTENKVMDLIKVSATSRSTAVAGAIAGGAVNQAIKAAAIARGYLLLDGIDVVLIPSFGEVDIEGAERTAIRFAVEPR